MIPTLLINNIKQLSGTKPIIKWSPDNHGKFSKSFQKQHFVFSVGAQKKSNENWIKNTKICAV